MTNKLVLEAHFYSLPPHAYVNRSCAAAGLGVSVSFLESKAHHGGGPAFYKFGRHVRYRVSDVQEWLAANSQRVESTSELAA